MIGLGLRLKYPFFQIYVHIYGRRIYLQGSNGETDIENRLMGMGRGEERGDVWGE